MCHFYIHQGSDLKKNQLKWIFRFAIPTVLAVGISVILLREIELKEIPETINRIPIHALLIGFVCYCLLVLAKTLRFKTILGLESNIFQVFPILTLHTFWGNFLPFRTGDISYVYLMRKRQKVEATQGIASLLIASIIDLVLLILLMSTTALLLLPKLSGKLSLSILFLIPSLFGVVLVTLIILACTAPNVCLLIAEKCLQPLSNLKNRHIMWCVEKCSTIIKEITSFRFNFLFFKIWIYSLLCLVIRFGFQCYLVSEMGVEIPMIEVLFALVFTNVFNLLPIQTVGNFGTTEFPYVWLLNYFGTTLNIATITGFSLHLLILLYCIPLGIYGFFVKRRE